MYMYVHISVRELFLYFVPHTTCQKEEGFVGDLTTSFLRLAASPKAASAATASHLLRLLLRTTPTTFNSVLQRHGR